MTRLIVNSDDYGRSAEISRGIREAHLRGIVTSTTCMMNFPTTAEDIHIAIKEAPGLGLGAHLVLTAGKPQLPKSKLGTLATPAGEFHKLPALLERLPDLDPAEAKQEWRAQIEAFIHAADRRPTHLDSHHHASYFSEELFRAMLELAQEYGCGIRSPKALDSEAGMDGLPPSVRAAIKDYAPRLIEEFNPPRSDAFLASFYDERATKDELLSMLNQLPDGDYELMCHPGYADTDLSNSSVYNLQRERELQILTDVEVLEHVRRRGIQLITFAEL